ncbi:hypothetical protein E2C01_016901 [Portunus trituberculatus]|uniref:Uncharacterized protein n=1 Tax=Portunus trituberculatus TaxID=210409 RepID=A0A5B7DS03_PORTR|nr:hypothetical protein [Portunus trituberculatus]
MPLPHQRQPFSSVTEPFLGGNQHRKRYTVTTQLILLQLVPIAVLFLTSTNTQVKTVNHHLQSGTCCRVIHARPDPMRSFFPTCPPAIIQLLLEELVSITGYRKKIIEDKRSCGVL